MDLPKATEQQAAEARSYDILRYKLAKHIGIFRNQTESDYGIDFEIELKINGSVTGRSIKAQVKSSKNLRPRKDGIVTVGGIKQSTLRYWCSIGQQTNVIAYAVDLESEVIFFAPNLFWQATKLIDGSSSSKTIKFVQHHTHQDELPVMLTLLTFSQPTISNIINAHRMALRGLKDYLSLLGDACQYDAGSTLHEPEHFIELLEVCNTLLWAQLDELWPDSKDRQNWDQWDYWDQQAMDEGWGELCYETVRPVITKLLVALIDEMRRLSKRIHAGKYYWAQTDGAYLKRVHETALPDNTDIETLKDWSDNFDTYQQRGFGDHFVHQARQPTAQKPRKEK